MSDFKQRLTSRKFLLSVGTSVVVILKGLGVLPMDDGSTWQLIAAVLSFIGVEGAKDIVGHWKSVSPTPSSKEDN